MNRDDFDKFEHLSTILRAIKRQAASRAGLQMVHYEILDLLSRGGKNHNTPLAVANQLGMTKGTVSQSIKLLINNGFLDKFPDREDKRVQRLSPTIKALDAIRFVNLELNALLSGVELSDTYARIFDNMISDIARQVEDAAAKRRAFAIRQRPAMKSESINADIGDQDNTYGT